MTYYISPRFLDKIAIHITKNYLNLPKVQVPLILGIHGRKGEGKTFQCKLVYDTMNILAIHISGGELESPDAGDPSRLIRLRYREAAELVRVRGQMCVLMINDLDAGAGRFDKGTQYTVNTQLVNATLMNIADNPTDVQLPGSYDQNPIRRVPIIITGNDLSTLYAPLIRDGRMEKFFWEPDHSDRLGIVSGIFSEDQLSPQEIETLVNQYSDQAIDFFSVLRSRFYDQAIIQFIHEVGLDKISTRVVNSKEKLPIFNQIKITLPKLIEFGNIIVKEQQRVQEMQLVREYNPHATFSPIQIMTSPHPITSNHHIPNNNSNPQLNPDLIKQIKELLKQGHKIALEHADQRRFKTSSWQSEPPITNQEESQILDSVSQYLTENSHNYIRLIGIDPKAKRRVLETIIHRPNTNNNIT